MYVELLTIAGSDDSIVRSALVSSSKDPKEYTDTKKRGLIRRLMQDKHGSPFESGYLEFYIEAPRGVRDEHVRHRIGSYSSTSLRYRMSNDPEVYVPSQDRPLKKVEGFKAMKPEYTQMNDDEYRFYRLTLISGYRRAQERLDELIQHGYDATEALRWITTDGLYTPYIARFNPRSLMHFLALRTSDETANHPSKPMWEIEDVARQIEHVFAEHFPETYASFNDFGREAP